MRPVFACAFVVATVALAALCSDRRCSWSAESNCPASTSHPRRQCEQREPCRLGQAGTQYARIADPELRRRQVVDGRRAFRAEDQQPRVQRRGPEHLLRPGHVAMGVGVGSVHRPRHGSPRRDARRADADVLRRERSARELTNDVGQMDFSRTRAAPGTGSSPRQQINTISDFLDASQVYGTTSASAVASG